MAPHLECLPRAFWEELHFNCGRERVFTSNTHNSLWEHSSHFRLIGRGVPSVSVVSQLLYNFLCFASPRENPQVPMWDMQTAIKILKEDKLVPAR